MRTILAGSRTCNNLQDMYDAIHFSNFSITEVLSGKASGADWLGELWAAENDIPVVLFPADWERYGKGAGFKRNALMAVNADQLIALWDGKSHGTKHMINTANALKLKVFVYEVDLCK